MRETGVVAWFSAPKGYGFVRRQSGPDLFVHFSDIQGEGFRSLNEGDEVEFEVVGSTKGPKAGNVRKLS